MTELEINTLTFLDYGPFDLALHSGEVFGITGPSGSGKSLFLRAVADLMVADGAVTLNGGARNDLPAPAWRRQVMLVPAEPQWWFETVGEHFPKEGRALDCQGFGLADDVLDWPVSRLSSGEKQRLGLARALARRPSVLLLDEPTANLDATNTALVEQCILSYLEEEQGAAIWVSHDGEQLDRVATRRVVIENGRFVKGEGGL